MTDYTVELKSLIKFFGRRLIFNNINAEYKKPGVFGITGPNGSGKSTLVKIIAGVNAPSKGEIIHKLDGEKLEDVKRHNHIGFSSPYLVMYDEFTAQENIEFIFRIRGINFNRELSDYLFRHFSIYDRRNDYVKAYSSGMKQRLKMIFAFVHDPEFIILDEPTSNLDEEGKEKVYKLIREYSGRKILIVASNEVRDIELCESTLDLNEFKTKPKKRYKI